MSYNCKFTSAYGPCKRKRWGDRPTCPVHTKGAPKCGKPTKSGEPCKSVHVPEEGVYCQHHQPKGGWNQCQALATSTFSQCTKHAERGRFCNTHRKADTLMVWNDSLENFIIRREPMA